MDAEIIAVGSELLTPQRIDTNSLYITDQLNARGVEVVRKSVVGDDRGRLAEEARAAVARSQVVVLTGGLGPTADDVTRDAVAAALGRRIEFREEICKWIQQRFDRMNRKMAEINKRQAYVIEGAEVLPNFNGTAPGQWVEHEGAVVILLPGPPNEMTPMFRDQCLPRLDQLLPRQVIRTRFFRVSGMTESDLDQLIAPVYSKYANPVTTILAAPGDIQVHLRARCNSEDEAETLLEDVARPIEKLLGDRIYSRNGDPIEKTVGDLLRAKSASLAAAESCTGGLLAERITSIPGSSGYFQGGFVTYTAGMKAMLLDVDRQMLAIHTAVSEPVAEAMALGTQRRAGADYALSITGYAGPDGGTEADPLGTVYIGLATPESCSVRRMRFLGDRARVRNLATQAALDLLRRALL